MVHRSPLTIAACMHCVCEQDVIRQMQCSCAPSNEMTQLKIIKEIRSNEKSRMKSIKKTIFCCNRTFDDELSICMPLYS